MARTKKVDVSNSGEFKHRSYVSENGETLYDAPIEIRDKVDLANYGITKDDCKYLHLGSSQRILVYFYKTTNRAFAEYQWEYLNNMHSSGYNSTRCIVPGTRKPFVKCPDTNKCSQCPYGRTPETKQAAFVSLDGLTDSGWESASEEYLSGKSYYQIGAELSADGIKTAAGSDYWLASTLKKILTNEKYIGDALLQKTVTTDFLTKKRVVNKGIVPQYYVEGSHEAIIPRELFMQVKEEMQRRARVETSTGKRRTYSGKYALSHHVYCAHCGDIFRRSQWFIRGERIPVWRCVSRLEKRKTDADCPSRTLYEKDLHAAVVTAFNQMIAMKDEFLPGMKLATERAISQTNGPRVAEIDERLKALQKELIKRANAKQNFDELADEINVLQEDKQALLLEDANRTGVKQRLDELEAFLDEQLEPVTDYDEGMVRKLIERITVFDDHLAFEFKCGLETEVQM